MIQGDRDEETGKNMSDHKQKKKKCNTWSDRDIYNHSTKMKKRMMYEVIVNN